MRFSSLKRFFSRMQFKLMTKLGIDPLENSFENSIAYWQCRAKYYGKKSVYNLSYNDKELSDVDSKQISIYERILTQALNKKREREREREIVALDFGCGPGRFEPMLSEMASKVYAVDPIASLLELCPRINNVDYLVYQNNIIPLETNSVDLIFISLVLGGITNDEELRKTIHELNRVANNGCCVFIAESTNAEAKSLYWHGRSAKTYQQLFNFCNLQCVDTYKEINEEVTIFIGNV